MTTAVATDLESIVRDNLKMLGIPNVPSDPTINCNCKVSVQRATTASPSTMPSLPTQVPSTAPSFVAMETPLAQFLTTQTAPVVSAPATQIKAIPSQFIPGLKTMPTEIQLNPDIPGNEPFILPVGVTPELIIDSQHLAAEEAYEAQLQADKLKAIAQEESAKAALIKAEQEASALAAKTAQTLRTTTETPLAIAVAVSPVTQEASASVPQIPIATSQTQAAVSTLPPAAAVPTPVVSTTTTATTIKEGFAPFPTKMQLDNDSSFDTQTILLFLFIGFIVYKLSTQ